MSKRYGRRLVLADVQLRIAAGDFALLTGANGAGKTTLLRIMATTLRPSTGRVRWDDAALGSSSELARAAVGFAGHQPLLYDELTAAENLRFVAQAHGVPDAAVAAGLALDAFGLSNRADERVAGFSRGMRQRLALARAFVVRPRLLLLDEPATALDEDGVATLLDRLRTAGAGVATVLATHDPRPFEAFATRRLEVRGGRLTEGGTG